MNPALTSEQDIVAGLYGRGLSVIPVPRPGPGIDGKTPLIKWREYQTRLPTAEELETWFDDRPPVRTNFAVITGAVSGVVVIDVDARDVTRDYRDWGILYNLPDTPWMTETAKGRHFWFRHPGGLVANRVRLKTDKGRLPIDIRGDAGYVMAPGSVHASGHVYRAVGDWSAPRAELPVFNPDWLPRSNFIERVTSHEYRAPATTDVITRARLYLAKIPAPEIGCGSDLAVFIAASRLVRGFALAPADAEELLWEWCGNRPGWDRDWVARKVSHVENRGAGEPMGGYLR